MLPFTSSGSSRAFSNSKKKRDTTLHSGKDFAVSPVPFDTIIPEGILLLSESASLLAPLAFLRMGITHYHAPTLNAGYVRTFLPSHGFRMSGDCLTQAIFISTSKQIDNIYIYIEFKYLLAIA